MSDGSGYEAVVVDGEGNTSTAIEGTSDRLQVADCNRQMIRNTEPRAGEMSPPTGR